MLRAGVTPRGGGSRPPFAPGRAGWGSAPKHGWVCPAGAAGPGVEGELVLAPHVVLGPGALGPGRPCSGQQGGEAEPQGGTRTLLIPLMS